MIIIFLNKKSKNSSSFKESIFTAYLIIKFRVISHFHNNIFKI